MINSKAKQADVRATQNAWKPKKKTFQLHFKLVSGIIKTFIFYLIDTRVYISEELKSLDIYINLFKLE